MTPERLVFALHTDGKKLTADFGSSGSRYYYLPQYLLHLERQGTYHVVVLSDDEGGASLLFLDATDGPGLAILERLPRRDDPATVTNLLRRLEQQDAVVALEDKPGQMSYDGRIVTVIIDSVVDFHRDDDPRRPEVFSIDPQPDGGLVVVISSGKDRTRVRVAPEHALATRRAALFLRPDHHAPAAANVKRWEYRVVKNMLASSLDAELNRLGGDGWEVVAITGLDGVLTLTGNKLVAVLKRPVAPRRP